MHRGAGAIPRPDVLEAAERYLARGWRLLLLKPGQKTPLPGSHGVKDATDDLEHLRARLKHSPAANLALACGPESGVLVLDVDRDPGKELDGFASLARLEAKLGPLPETVTSRTPRGGEHRFFRFPARARIKNGASVGGHEGLDVRSAGGYVVLPPSRLERTDDHPGGAYEWIRSPGERELAELPAAWVEFLSSPARTPAHAPREAPYGGGQGVAPERAKRWAEAALENEVAILAATGRGKRNDQLRDSALKLGHKVGSGLLPEDVVVERLLEASRVNGYLQEHGEHKARDTLTRALEKGKSEPEWPAERSGVRVEEEAGAPAGRKRRAARDVLFELGGEVLDVFCDPGGAAFARFAQDGHVETWPLSSGVVRGVLSAVYQEREGRIPPTQALRDALAALEDRAQMAPARPVYLRTAHVNGETFIDLGREDWRAVRVRPGGWEVIDRLPDGVSFWRSRQTGPLPLPERGGTVEDLAGLLHVRREDLPLLVAWLVASLGGRGPFPVLVLTGEAGSAKTTTARLCKSLADPSPSSPGDPVGALLRGAPREDRDLAAAARSSWVVALDNLSRIRDELSDVLCRLSTGGGHASRALYTNAEEFVLQATRPVVLTSIGTVVGRADLLDRSLVVDLPPIPDAERLDEAAYWGRVRAARGRLFGFLLDALATGLQNLPVTGDLPAPRLADFARLAAAAAPAFGLSPEGLLEILAENRHTATAALVEESVLARPLAALARRHPEGWTGTATALLDELARSAGKDRERPSWPATASQLGGMLRQLAPALRRAEIVDVTKGRGKRGRFWTVRPLPGGKRILRERGDGEGDGGVTGG